MIRNDVATAGSRTERFAIITIIKMSVASVFTGYRIDTVVYRPEQLLHIFGRCLNARSITSQTIFTPIVRFQH